MKAVKDNKFVTVPFSQTTPGAELVDGAKTLNDGWPGLPGSEPLAQLAPARHCRCCLIGSAS